MRVQCDVCENAEAAVMCCADEAALCAECDLNVHAANKLAIKHQRVPLLKDSDAPRCDICQEKTGYFFCLQDRALLCRNCDVSIHSANALSSSHRRFLVTGVKVALDAITAQEPSAGSSEGSLKSVTSAVSPPIANASKASHPPPVSTFIPKGLSGTFLQPVASHSVSGITSKSSTPSAVSVMVSPAITPYSVSEMGLMPATPSSASSMVHMMAEPSHSSQNGYENFYKRSSISEFLTEAIPGWRVDELLNLPDLAGGYTLGDIASSKADAVNLGEFDWTADISLFDEQVCADPFHQVPELLSLGSVGFPRQGRLMPNTIKGKAKQDMVTGRVFDDAFTVPDLDANMAREKISGMARPKESDCSLPRALDSVRSSEGLEEKLAKKAVSKSP